MWVNSITGNNITDMIYKDDKNSKLSKKKFK